MITVGLIVGVLPALFNILLYIIPVGVQLPAVITIILNILSIVMIIVLTSLSIYGLEHEFGQIEGGRSASPRGTCQQ